MSYHFEFGDSVDGPVSYSALVVATSPEAAVARLRAQIEEALDYDESHDRGDLSEFIASHYNPEKISTANIFESSEAFCAFRCSEPAIGIDDDGELFCTKHQDHARLI